MAQPTRAPVVTQPIDVMARINGERIYWFRAHRRALERVKKLSKAYQRAWTNGEACLSEMDGLHEAKARERFCFYRLGQSCGWWTR